MGNNGETKYDRLLRWRNGETPGPWTISIYPTYRCNIQCKICWKREFDEPLTPKEELPTERLLRLPEEAAELGVRDWIIGGGGELMLRGKAVTKMLQKIRALDMNGLVQTNATRFTDEQLETLVDIQWKNFTVSLDGPTAAINDANRIEKNFDRAIETIKKLQAIKKRRNSVFPQINLISVVTLNNYQHLKGMVDLSEELELSPGGSLSAVDLIVYGDHDRQYQITGEARDELPGIVADTIDYANRKGVAHNYETFLAALNEGKKLDAMDLFHQPEDRVSHQTMCFEPFLHMLILPQGMTGPCCTFYEQEKANTVWETSMRDVWMGPYMHEVRQQILQGKPMEYCQECMITRIQENRNMQTHLRPIQEYVESDQPTDWVGLVAKANSSLRRHGLKKSVQRGREWLELRRLARR